MIQVSDILSIISILISIIAPCLLWLLGVERRFGKTTGDIGRVDEKINGLEKRLEDANRRIQSTEEWARGMAQNVASWLLKNHKGNPLNPEEQQYKNELLRKIELGIPLGTDEARILKQLMDREMEDARNSGNLGAVFAIGLLLLFLAYIIGKE